MPESNVDLVRRIYQEFNQTRELSRWALREDVEWYPPADEPDNGMRRGAERVAAYVRGWAASFDDYHVAVEGIFERGDSVFVPARLIGRIRDGSTELSQPVTQVWTIDGGLVIRVREFRTKEEALAAV